MSPKKETPSPCYPDATLEESAPLTLKLDPEQLASCTACGMCLPHCPTYRVTGEEAASPRGRLALMSAVQKSGVAEPSFAEHMELCVLCRGCETACPAGVPFGHLMEQTREALASKSEGDRASISRRLLKVFQRKTENKHAENQQERLHSSSPLWLRLGYKLLPHRRLLRSAVAMGAVAQRLHLVPKKLNLPAIPIRQGKLHPSGDPSRENSSLGSTTGSSNANRGKSDFSTAQAPESVLTAARSKSKTGKSEPNPSSPSTDMGTVWLFTGCIMDASMREVHHASQKVIEATGAKVGFPSGQANCCGSLHRHAGLAEDAAKLARRTMAAFPGTAPILVNSAGCGAVLKDYGNILQTEEARKFSSRVKDIHEWLAEHELPRVIAETSTASTATSDATATSETATPQPVASPANISTSHSSIAAPKSCVAHPCVAKPKVAILDPCHLRHAQGAHNSVREALQPFAEIVELDDQGMCCGAGGAYSITHPEVATAIRNRKIEAIQRSGATQVAAANPGCILHLQNPLQTLEITITHPTKIIANHL